LWILDSRESCHYCQSAEGLTDIKEIDELIKIGNGDSMKSTKIGNLKSDSNLWRKDHGDVKQCQVCAKPWYKFI
jgi:hypothetical protein